MEYIKCDMLYIWWLQWLVTSIKIKIKHKIQDTEYRGFEVLVLIHWNSMFQSNIGATWACKKLVYYMALYARDENFKSHCCDNLISYKSLQVI
jgi:hypothetical protein